MRVPIVTARRLTQRMARAPQGVGRFDDQRDRLVQFLEFVHKQKAMRYRGIVCALFERAQYKLIHPQRTPQQRTDAKRAYGRLAECVYAIYDAPKKYQEEPCLEKAFASLRMHKVSARGPRSSKATLRLLKPLVPRFYEYDSVRLYKPFGLTRQLAPNMGRTLFPSNRNTVSLGAAAGRQVRDFWLKRTRRVRTPAYTRTAKRVPIEEMACCLASKKKGSLARALALCLGDPAAAKRHFHGCRTSARSPALGTLMGGPSF